MKCALTRPVSMTLVAIVAVHAVSSIATADRIPAPAPAFAFAFEEPDADGDGLPGVSPSGAPGGAVTTPRTPGRLAGGERALPRGTGGFLLVDRSHGQNVSFDGLLADIEAHGWTVVQHEIGPITPALLAPFDAIMIPTPVGAGYPNLSPGVDPFAPAEVAAIVSFYTAGRGVWIFSEYLQDPAGVNSVAGEFGVTFHGDVVEDPDAATSFIVPITDIVAHPITAGISTYFYIAGCSLEAESPAAILATADENAFSDAFSDDGYAAGEFPPVLAVLENAAGGCAVFQGDINIVEPLIGNVLECLDFEGPITVALESWGNVKSKYRE